MDSTVAWIPANDTDSLESDLLKKNRERLHKYRFIHFFRCSVGSITINRRNSCLFGVGPSNFNFLSVLAAFVYKIVQNVGKEIPGSVKQR